MTGVFNHPAVITIILDVVWGPTQKLRKLIPTNCTNLDVLLAFTVTIIRWVLKNLGRPEAPFETAIYTPFYEKTLDHLGRIHGGQDPVGLLCLENLTYAILACGRQLSQMYSY